MTLRDGQAERSVIRPPDHRLRVFVSSTLRELAPERARAQGALERLRLSPVMFELGARPHPPRELYRAYLEQSQVFVGIYWQSYGWVAPGESISGLEDEYRLAGGRPRLLYIKEPAPERDPELSELLAEIKADERISYKRFSEPEELEELIAGDLAVLMAERFEQSERAEQAQRAAPPTPLSPIVGRESELDEVSSALADTRLLTVTGPGGIGKTRLAIEAANAAAEDFAGGVHYVPLASVRDGHLVLRAVADRVGARMEGAIDARGALIERFGNGGPALLVLDNFEQVAEVAPDLGELLEACPPVTMLVTSRHSLRLRGERELKLDALPVPEPGADPATQPAVQLFIARAREARPGFDPAGEDAEAVVEVCRRLEGIPLALELAAARVALLPPAALVERLGQSLDLAGRASDLPERQRTLRATMDWSHELLSAPERELFARLGVFAGGFSLEAAEAVSADALSDPEAGLASLLDKSLVSPSRGGRGAEPRFRMLDTIRAYARERLQESTWHEDARRRHLDWYLRLGNRAQPHLCGPGQRDWTLRLDPDRADLRAAVATALDLGDYGAVIELAWDVVVFYFVRDAIEEPDSWMRAVAESAPELNDVQDAKLRSLLALTRIARGDYEGARERLSSALAVFRDHGMKFESAVTLHQLAWVRFHLEDDPEGATDALAEASRLFDAIGHDWGVALVETMHGSVLAALGEFAGSERHQHRSLERSMRIENDPLIATALQQIALVRVLDDRAEDAMDALEEAARIVTADRYRTEASYCLDALGAAAVALGHPAAGARALAGAEATRDRLGLMPWPSVGRVTARFAASARDSLGEEEFQRARDGAATADPFELADEVLAVLR